MLTHRTTRFELEAALRYKRGLMTHLDPLPTLLTLQALEHLPRTGWLQRGVAQAESIAAHTTGVAFVVLALGPRVEPPIETERALAMAILHDAPEALLGDLPRSASELLPPGAKDVAEQRAAERLLPQLSALAVARHAEYRAGLTREARFARLCDRLHLGVRWVAYLRSGARGLAEFRATIEALDCSAFPPCEELRRSILAAARDHGE